LAGYIMNRTGTIPQQGAVIDIDSLRFTILQRSATRLDLIRLERID
ncbi:MAG: hemolysin, partial [Duncaniella sp.]|nr:hemolysin [Duncaniella sp.]